MQKIILLAIVSITILNSCKKCDDQNNIPACIQERIEEFTTNPSCAESVEEYLFQGAVVYAFENGICPADIPTEILSASCNTIGSIGGLSGNKEVNGEDFDNATFVRTVWKK